VKKQRLLKFFEGVFGGEKKFFKDRLENFEKHGSSKHAGARRI
jgi:hypothetical protein